jgi:hypothetical protein
MFAAVGVGAAGAVIAAPGAVETAPRRIAAADDTPPGGEG